MDPVTNNSLYPVTISRPGPSIRIARSSQYVILLKHEFKHLKPFIHSQ